LVGEASSKEKVLSRGRNITGKKGVKGKKGGDDSRN